MTSRRPPGRGGPRGGPRRGRPRFYARRKVCSFCVNHVKHIDYKDVDTLRRYISDRFRIQARRRTGTCAKHQRALAMAIKRARHLAMVPIGPGHLIPAPARAPAPAR
jgi:small subunit ribosomal protein S18